MIETILAILGIIFITMVWIMYVEQHGAVLTRPRFQLAGVVAALGGVYALCA